jgi:hypothetical protein
VYTKFWTLILKGKRPFRKTRLRLEDDIEIVFGMKVVLKYEGVCKSFRTGRLERELQMVQFSATRCSCVALVSFAAITLCVASQ